MCTGRLISGFVDEIVLNLTSNDLLLKTCHAGKWRPLIGPASGSLTLTNQWCEHSGPASLPRSLFFIECGVIRIVIGQEHVLCFQQIAEHLQDFIKV